MERWTQGKNWTLSVPLDRIVKMGLALPHILNLVCSGLELVVSVDITTNYPLRCIMEYTKALANVSRCDVIP